MNINGVDNVKFKLPISGSLNAESNLKSKAYLGKLASS